MGVSDSDKKGGSNSEIEIYDLGASGTDFILIRKITFVEIFNAIE